MQLNEKRVVWALLIVVLAMWPGATVNVSDSKLSLEANTDLKIDAFTVCLYPSLMLRTVL